jgi:EpsI family protein
MPATPVKFGPLRFLDSAPKRVLSIFLIAQAALFYGFSRKELLPSAPPLSTFPSTIGAWHMIEESPIDEDTREVLKADDLMSRVYARPDENAAAGLFIAAFRSQRTGKAPHSPKNCLPGAGWSQLASNMIPIDIPGFGRITVNHYIVVKGDQRAAVLYWYESRDRVVASEYKAKFYVVADAIRYNRTDTALVRVYVPVLSGNAKDATATAVDFVKSAFPEIRAHLPS